MYEIPIGWLWVIMIVAAVGWGVTAWLIKKRSLWRRINAIVLVAECLLVVGLTLLGRGDKGREFSLVPFYSFQLAHEYADVYIQMVLNVMMFLPFGMAAPFVFSGFTKHPLWLTAVCAVTLSVLVEVLQYRLASGYADIDDVIFNTFGTLVGFLAYGVCRQLQKRMK